MRGEWNISIPDREKDEEDITDKQIHFVEKLYKSLNAEGLPFDTKTLGKWQASALIDQLIEIRDQREESGSFEGYEEAELAEPAQKKNPFFATKTGQLVKVPLLVLVAIVIVWIVVFS